LIDGNQIVGQYSIPHTRVVSDWTLNIRDRGLVSKLVNFKDKASDVQVIALIRNLQSKLSELRQERTDLTGKLERHFLERHFNVESQQIIFRLEQDIEDLKMDVEYEINLQTDRIDLEKREVTRRLGRNRVVGELDRELDLVIAEKWNWFDEEASSTMTAMENELDELEHQQATQIKRISRLVEDTRLDLQYQLDQYGISLDQVRNQDRDQQTDNLVNVSVRDDSPETPREQRTNIERKVPAVSDSPAKTSKSAEDTQTRGFFLNSETGALADLGGSLDPTTLAMLGILITLAATGIQLLKGN